MSSKPKPASGQLKDVARPEGVFVMLELELLVSPAWQGQSINCRRLIDRLMIEHMRHAGQENGNLKVSYDHFEEGGIARVYIKPAQLEAVARGLVAIEEGHYRGAAQTVPSKYRLTFLPGVHRGELGLRYFGKATHEWRRFRPPGKTVSMVHKRGLVQSTNVDQTSPQMCTGQKKDRTKSMGATSPQTWTPFYIWGEGDNEPASPC